MRLDKCDAYTAKEKLEYRVRKRFNRDKRTSKERQKLERVKRKNKRTNK